MLRKQTLFVLPIFALALAGPLLAAERHRMMRPIVPADQLEAARALKNPLPYSPEIVQKGKTLYESKGTCFNCHGLSGRGDGPGGVNMDPAPRSFHHRGMWRHRHEGEIFWIIKNGSPGTGMIPFGGLLTDEEIWTVIQYERNFASRGHRPGRGDRHGDDRMGPRGPRRERGPRGDLDDRGHRRSGSGMNRGEGECCQ